MAFVLTLLAIASGLIGFICMYALAQPSIEASRKDWRGQVEFAVTFLDRYGMRGVGEKCK